jgi:thiol:disulfide interchange protein
MNLRWFTLLVLLAVEQIQSFQTLTVPRRSRRTTSPQFYAIAAVERHSASSSFRQRMLQGMKPQDKIRKPRTHKSSLIKEVRTLKEYKKVVVDEAEGSLVVVWFYATWCRACKGLAPGMFALAKHHPEIKFVQVPALEDNTNLHQGLGVPSVPFVHLYHPDGALVEEQKLTRKILPGFHKMLQDYQDGSCSLERTNEWSTSSPYGPAPKAKDF